MAGPPPDFSDFVREHEKYLLRFAERLTGDYHTAQDVVQSALERIFPRWDGLDHTRNVKAYTIVTIVNCYRNEMARPSRQEIPLAEMPELPSPGMAERVVSRRDLVNVLRLLTDRQQSAVTLLYIYDLSQEQTALIMGCPPGAVGALAFRGTQTMRILLDDTSTGLD